MKFTKSTNASKSLYLQDQHTQIEKRKSDPNSQGSAQSQCVKQQRIRINARPSTPAHIQAKSESEALAVTAEA